MPISLRALPWAAIGLIFLAAAAVIYGARATGPTPLDAFDACKRFATNRLKIPSTLQFSAFDAGVEGSRAVLLGQHPPRFAVSASFGKPAQQSTLRCDVSYENEADGWKLIALSSNDQQAE